MYISQLYAGRNINSKTMQEIEKTTLTLHDNEINGDFSCYRHSKYHILYFVNSEKNAEMDNSSYMRLSIAVIIHIKSSRQITY